MPEDRDQLARDLIGCFPVLDKSDRTDAYAIDGPTTQAAKPIISDEAGWAFDEGASAHRKKHGGTFRHCCTRAGIEAAYSLLRKQWETERADETLSLDDHDRFEAELLAHPEARAAFRKAVIRRHMSNVAAHLPSPEKLTEVARKVNRVRPGVRPEAARAVAEALLAMGWRPITEADRA